MTKKMWIKAAMAMFISGVLLVFGCRHHSNDHHADRMINYLEDELKLTQDQTDMLNQFKAEMAEKRDDLHTVHEDHLTELMSQFKSEAVDEYSLMNMYLETKPKIDEMASFVISRLAAFHRTLTPVQRGLLADKLESLEKLHHYFHE